MKTFVKLAACAAALAAVAGCGDDRGADGLSSDERERLNALAESQDLNNADLVDTSPDSLVPEEEVNAEEPGEAVNEGADAAPEANAAAANTQ